MVVYWCLWWPGAGHAGSPADGDILSRVERRPRDRGRGQQGHLLRVLQLSAGELLRWNHHGRARRGCSRASPSDEPYRRLAVRDAEFRRLAGERGRAHARQPGGLRWCLRTRGSRDGGHAAGLADSGHPIQAIFYNRPLF